MVRRFEVYWVNLDPTVGAEIKKKRPCVVVSPDVMNEQLKTIVIAPLTSTLRNWPTRVRIKLAGKEGEVVLDQVRSIDKKRILSKLGELLLPEAKSVSEKLVEMFKY